MSRAQPSAMCEAICGGITNPFLKTGCFSACSEIENTPITPGMVYYPSVAVSSYFTKFGDILANNINHLTNEIFITIIIYSYYPVILLIFFGIASLYFIGKVSLMFTVIVLAVTVLVFLLFGNIYSSKLNNFINLHKKIISETFQQEITNNPDFFSALVTPVIETWSNSGPKGNKAGQICPPKSKVCSLTG